MATLRTMVTVRVTRRCVAEELTISERHTGDEVEAFLVEICQKELRELKNGTNLQLSVKLCGDRRSH